LTIHSFIHSFIHIVVTYRPTYNFTAHGICVVLLDVNCYIQYAILTKRLSSSLLNSV